MSAAISSVARRLSDYSLWSSEQRQAWDDTCAVASHSLTQISSSLGLISYDDWSKAMAVAVLDAYRAGRSACQFWFLTLRPILLLVYVVIRQLGIVIYDYILVQGLYRHGLHHLHAVGRFYWSWQTSLTRQQLYYEAGGLVSLLFAGLLYRFLLRQTYTKRIQLWYSLQQTKLQRVYARHRDRVVQVYTNTVDRISRVSLVCAVLLPHALFWSLALVLRLLLPRLVNYLATQTLLTALLSTGIPVVCSILLVHDLRSFDRQKLKQHDLDPASEQRNISPKNNNQRRRPQDDKENTTTKMPRRKARTPLFSRTHPSSISSTSKKTKTNVKPAEDDPVLDVIEQLSLDERTQFWLDYWLVHAALQVSASILRALPLVGRLVVTATTLYGPAISCLELFLYLWFYAMPYLLTTATASNGLEGRPLPVMSRLLQPLLLKLTSNVASLVSPETWNMVVVATVSPFLHVAEVVRLLSPGSSDAIRTILRQVRTILLPSLWLFVPLPGVSSIAVLYTQWVLPMSQTTTTAEAKVGDARATGGDRSWTSLVALEFWVLQTLATVVLSRLSAVLWLVPFANVGLFAFWWYLSLHVSQLYGVLQRDLQLLGLLERDDVVHGEEESTTTVYRVVCWVLQRLPSAADSEKDQGDAVNIRDANQDADHVDADDPIQVEQPDDNDTTN